jgi:hypothetical protein
MRLPYYKLGFSSWKRVDGCKPLSNPQASILMERKPPPLPGEKELLARQATEKRKVDAEEARRRKAAQKAESKQSRSQAASIEKVALMRGDQPISMPQEVECKPPPAFDMLELPDAMDKMGFNVGAKLSRRWFNGRKHEIPDGPGYIYPSDMVDTTTVSLDFILFYKKARAKYGQPINEDIRNDAALELIKKRMSNLVRKHFAYSGELDTLSYSGSDVQSLHGKFWFQRMEVSSFKSLTWIFGLTDLTASLANFYFFTAIANARVYCDKYYS